MSEPLLQVHNLTVERSGRAILDRVSFEVEPGSVVGLFGESGCGKTTLALSILGLLPADCRMAGSIRFRGKELAGLGERAFQGIRGAAISMIFQDPMLALNPVMRIGRQVAEVAVSHGVSGEVAAALRLAGLEPSERVLRSFPHQLSGGQRQRVAIAQALVCHPALVIADEPFTALDGPRVVEVANLIRNLRQETGAAFVVISHTPGVLARIADYILVMRAGRIVEHGPPRRVFGAPVDPYTAALVAAAEGNGARA